METCSLCGGNLALLGQLGCLLWFKCRACGMEFNQSIPVDIYGVCDREDDQEDGQD